MDEKIIEVIKDKLGDELASSIQSEFQSLKESNSKLMDLQKTTEELKAERERLLSHTNQLLEEKKREKEKRDQALGELTNKDETLKEMLKRIETTQGELDKFRVENRNSKVREQLLASIGSKVVDGSQNDVINGIFQNINFDEDGKPILDLGSAKLTDVGSMVDKYLELKPWFKSNTQKSGAGTTGQSGSSNSEIEQAKKLYEKLSNSHSNQDRAKALTLRRKLASQGVEV